MIFNMLMYLIAEDHIYQEITAALDPPKCAILLYKFFNCINFSQIAQNLITNPIKNTNSNLFLNVVSPALTKAVDTLINNDSIG